TITNGTTASTNNSYTDSGAVYVYKRSGSTWAQEAYIKASNNNSGDYLGYSVALSGNTIAVGAYQEDSNQTTITNGTSASTDNSISSSGAVYVFTREADQWSAQAYVKASNNNGNDLFGYNVALSGDTLAVGAYNEDSNQTTITNGTTASTDNSNSASGAVYVYKRTGNEWAQEAYIKASNNNASDQFGYNVALSGDTLAVGAHAEDSNQTTITNGTTASTSNSSSDSGAVYVYKRTGSTWAQEGYIKAPNSGSGDQFGVSVAIAGDTIVVGAHGEDSSERLISNGVSAATDNTATDSGAVYVYRNKARLFDVPEVFATADSSSATLNWQKSGGTATTYLVVYDIGLTPPGDCGSGTLTDAGDVNTIAITGLSPDTDYAFRVCAAQDLSTYSSGMTVTVRTQP
ncbi:MAG: fibronectin type III domain-containing protein, partial [Bacteriovoracia bacterium]